MNGYQELERRVDRLEAWRDRVDEERGIIMRELGELTVLCTSIRDQMKEVAEKLEERPSQTEFKVIERSIESMRAKAREDNTIRSKATVKLFELTGPFGWKFKSLGFSGITIILVVSIIVSFLMFYITKHIK